jgi:hypothetical protein
MKNSMAAESEPNDTKAQANTLALSGSNSGAIGSATDIDWWKVTTNSDGKLNITIAVSNSEYLWCQIYDNDGITLLTQGYTAATTTVSQDGLAKGTYYLKLYPYYGGHMPAYTISNTLDIPAQAYDAEPNDSRAEAIILPLNSSATGHINYYYNNKRDSSDWYKLTTNENGRIRLTISSANGQYVWAYLYDNDGATQLDAGYTSGNTVVVNKDGLAAGVYYIKIKTYYTNDFAPYTLSDSLFTPAVENDTEPNNLKAQALTLPLNSSATGHINYYYNNKRDSSDWYKLTTNSDGRIRLTIKSGNGQNVWAYLYDKDGTTLLDADYTSGNAVVVNRDGLAAGTYYIRVNTYYTNEFAPYTLYDSLFTTHKNDTEPNNAKAQAIALPLNDSVKGHINYYYDKKKDSTDWYKLVTNSGGRIRLKITSANGQNVWAYLFDNDGTTQLDAGYTSGSAVVVNKDGLAAGTYYIRVNTYYTSEFAPYTLEDSLFTPQQADDPEPNNIRAQALTLPLNGSKTGYVNYYYDHYKDTADWYKLTTLKDGVITLDLQSYNGQNKWVYLFDNNGTTLLKSAYSSTSTSITFDGAQAGTYYVRVNPYYTSEFGPYTLSNTVTYYSFENDSEPNGYANQGQVVTPNTTTGGHAGFYYNNRRDTADWFKLTYTGKDGNLSFTISQEEKKTGGYDNLWFRLYKDTTASPVHSSYAAVANRTVDLTDMQKGDYWIKVFPYYSSDFSSYSFLNTFTPEEEDLCDGIDNDGDGEIDEDAEKFTWYVDADGDGYGNPNVTKLSCSQPAGYVADNTDCNDADNTIYPNAPELCDGKDNDCDGLTDEDGGVTWYKDADGDGYGDASISQKACAQPTGYVADNTDCNDNDADVYPGATEIADGKDNNCNGEIDEGTDTGNNVSVSVYDMIQQEPDLKNANMPFLVRLGKPSDREVRVDYTTQDNSAKAGSDYIAQNGTVVFAPGERVKRIVISIKGDAVKEKTEKFNLVLSNPLNDDLGRKTASGFIMDNDDKKVQAIADDRSASIAPSIEKGLKISPNPASGKANISLAGYSRAVTILVSNMQGKMLLQKKVQLYSSKLAFEPLDVSMYASGIYVVTVIDEKGNRQSAQLVVQK